MANPKACIECDLYLYLPHGVQMTDGTRRTHVLKLLKNVHGQKQSGRKKEADKILARCAKFCEDPRETHVAAVEHIDRYLKVPQDINLSGKWFKKIDMTDATNAKSRTGYIITYANWPMLWASKLQTLATLSTIEAEYVALSIVVREAIVVMNFLKEIETKGITKANTIADIYCKVFGGSSGTLELARFPKMRPRTKHINL
eukprot:15366807-Ditylum_brightwellii.AAC.1